jgi:Tfp pilus assembly protein PilN
LVVVHAGVPVFTKDSAVGGRNLTAEIQRNLNLSYVDAESLKIGGGPDGSTPQEVSDLMHVMADNFAIEIKRAIDFYNASSSEAPIAYVLLAGGSSKIPGLSKVVEEALVMLPFIVGVAATYMLDSYKEDEINKIQKLIEKHAAEGRKLQTEVAKFKGYEGIKKALDEDETTIRTKLDTIQKLTETRAEPVKMLSLLSTSIPKDVWLTEYRIDRADISLKGSTVDFNQISDFMKNLRDSTRFADVELRDSQQQKEQAGGRVASVFELKATWR